MKAGFCARMGHPILSSGREKQGKGWATRPTNAPRHPVCTPAAKIKSTSKTNVSLSIPYLILSPGKTWCIIHEAAQKPNRFTNKNILKTKGL
jgi:hypothetical protein